MPETLKLAEAAPGLVIVTLDRPAAANALNTRMGEELLLAWTEIAARPDLRCVVLAAEGRHFCAGADLKERNGMTDEAWAAQHRIFEAMIRAQLAVPVPVIAAVNGAAMGGGCEMTLACDFAYAADTARFGLPEAGLGIMPGLGGTQLLRRAVGERRALELLTTGRPFTAAEALDYGVVNGVAAPEALMATVREVGGRIAANAPLSVRALKHVVREGHSLDLAAAMEMELTAYNRLFKTADRREGVASFNDKRAPAFEGR
ncbi:enoyl-CoA hydratase [Phenylobacterium hankyongense]|uniref:Enoyl-CoA hydratase n=1 Tax=Phenylobacterium hankyongense TaxID=1813876 RepID=A0A328AZ79_9CAUL|nr:enoyl-CoA hydratase-related protein [Phenylobacterium hankyongense]RAK58976.1 enoyl-CoA hydratase [Phenylobacterium hankyongense]